MAARTAAADADAAVAAADAAVAATESRIAELNVQTDQVVVDAFISPPSEDAIETLVAPTLSESTVRQSILDRQTDANVEALDELEAAEAQLDAERTPQEDAVETAEQRRRGRAGPRGPRRHAVRPDPVRPGGPGPPGRQPGRGQLARRHRSRDRGRRPPREGELAALLGAVVSDREQRAAEAALQQAMADAAARAAARAAERPSSSSSGGVSLGPASGSLSDVACPGGGSITIDGSMASSLASMLDAAAADGNNLCGGGYRDPAAQIALREANCGSSTTPSTRPRRRRARRRPHRRARPITSREPRSTSRATAGARSAGPAPASPGSRRTRRATASTTCRASPGTGATTARSGRGTSLPADSERVST